MNIKIDPAEARGASDKLQDYANQLRRIYKEPVLGEEQAALLEEVALLLESVKELFKRDLLLH